jgi:hypothetical protein
MVLRKALMESVEVESTGYMASVETDRINSEGDGSPDRVGEAEGGNVEGAGGVLGRGESSRSATGSLSLKNSITQRCFLVRLAGGGS